MRQTIITVIFSLPFMFFLLGCSHLSDRKLYLDLLSPGSHLEEVTMWAKVAGEFVLFPERPSGNLSISIPNCISGVTLNQYDMDKSLFKNKYVLVSGVIYEYDNLPSEESEVLARKKLNGVVIINNCFGKNVLWIENIQIVQRLSE